MKQPRSFGGLSASGRALVVGVLVVLLCTVAGASPVAVADAQRSQGAQDGARTVDSCTTIDRPGRYVLTGNVTGAAGGEDENCIEIAADDVVFDGQGHTLSGDGAGHGVEVNGSENVTVRRLRASNWSIGVFYLGAGNGTIERTIADGNVEGIKLGAASDSDLRNNTAYDNAIGISLGGQSQNNTLRDNAAVDNKWGIHFERESGNNSVVNNVARNNTRWDYYAERDRSVNTVRNLELSTTTISFTERNVALRSVTSPPPLPRGTQSTGTFVETARTRGGDSTLSLTMPSDGGSATVWQARQSSWSRVPDSRTRTDGSSNAVTVNASTSFGIFAPLADANGNQGGPVTVSADPAPPVQRTLTPVETSTDTPERAATPEQAATAANPDDSTASAGGRTTVASGENEATQGGFDLDVVRVVFALLGVVGLAALGLAALRQRR